MLCCSCEYLHGDTCDMCNRQCLNPFDPEQQKGEPPGLTSTHTPKAVLVKYPLFCLAHRKECLEMHEQAMEKAFQAQEYVSTVVLSSLKTSPSRKLSRKLYILFKSWDSFSWQNINENSIGTLSRLFCEF